MRLPTFLVAGANTSGTTSLYHYLRQHPQVFMSPIKEPTTLAAPDLGAKPAFQREIARQRAALRAYLDGARAEPADFWVPDWDDYVSLFAAAGDRRAVGEASVSYLWLPSAAAGIRARLPEARLVFLLRNPVDRLFSWYLINRARAPRLAFRDWFLEAREPGGDGTPGVGRYTLPLDGGWYSAHLGRFVALFPREHVRIFLHDDFSRDPRAVLRELFAFIGVAPDQPIDLTRRVNETLVPRFPRLERLRRRLLPGVALAGWLPAPAARAVRAWYRRGRGSFAFAPADRQLALEFYREEIRRTQDLIGRDLSGWLR